MSDSTTPTVAKPKRTATIPKADLDFGQVAKDVSEKWATTPEITLNWTDQAQFAVTVTGYSTVLTTRRQVGDTRPQKTKAIELLEDQMDNSLSYVKGYIIDKYKKETASSYYPAFGMVFRNKTYAFPKDQNGRSEGLTSMKNAIDTHGFGTKEFGTTYWTTIKTDYDTLLSQAKGTDTTVSDKVGDKNALKATITKTLNALIGQIKSNYPDTYKTVLRTWGFHKEKY